MDLLLPEFRRHVRQNPFAYSNRRQHLLIRGLNKSSKILRFFPQSVFSPRGNVINSCA
jgi:hypothetical protein